MKPIEKGLLILVCCAVACVAVAGYWINQKADAASDSADRIAVNVQVRDQVAELPEDGKTYHLVLLLHDDWKRRPKERRIVMAFDTNPALVSLKAQCYYHVITETSPEFKENFAGAVNQLPCVLLEAVKSNGKGDVKVKISGDNIPEDESYLASAFDKVCTWRPHPLRPWLNHPSPNPCPDCTPQPRPKPKPEPDREPIPDTPLPPRPEFPFGALLACVLLTGGATAVIAFRRRVNG